MGAPLRGSEGVAKEMYEQPAAFDGEFRWLRYFLLDQQELFTLKYTICSGEKSIRRSLVFRGLQWPEKCLRFCSTCLHRFLSSGSVALFGGIHDIGRKKKYDASWRSKVDA